MGFKEHWMVLSKTRIKNSEEKPTALRKLSIESKILAFLGLTGNFEPCVTPGRFDKRPRDT
jgi:hypothetical protein